MSVNGTDARYKSHDDVVAMVRECREEVTLEVATPSETPPTSPLRVGEGNDPSSSIMTATDTVHRPAKTK